MSHQCGTMNAMHYGKQVENCYDVSSAWSFHTLATKIGKTLLSTFNIYALRG